MIVMNRTPYVQADHFVSSNGTDPQNMFTDVVGTKTTRAGDLIVVLTPGFVGTIGFAGLEGTALSVVGESGTTEVFRHEQTLRDEIITDWFEYFFEPFAQISDVFVDEIPPYSDIELTITVEGTDTACGLCAFGALHRFGSTEAGAKVEIIDYSTKEVDATTGVVTLEPGPFSRRISGSIFLNNGEINRMQKVLANMRATATFYSLADDATFESVMTIFGFYRDFSIVIPYPQNSLCSIDIEGLI